MSDKAINKYWNYFLDKNLKGVEKAVWPKDYSISAKKWKTVVNLINHIIKNIFAQFCNISFISFLVIPLIIIFLRFLSPAVKLEVIKGFYCYSVIDETLFLLFEYLI